MKVLGILITGGVILAAALFAAASAFVRHPALIPWRPWLPAASAAIALLLLLPAAWSWRHKRRLAAATIALAAIAAFASVIGQDWTFETLKARVLATPEGELRAVGRHLMVGYVDIADLAPLITRAGVAGVFVAKRNAEHTDARMLAADIRSLQELRAQAGLPPLWIAGDQEGGLVASLSPPLPHPPALASLATDPAALRASAAAQAQQLACAGVNLNFAPVVDLKGARDPADRYSHIAERSISRDPAIVANAARLYCETLSRDGVRCTLKHFPGLGRVGADTHVREAILPDLEEADLRPFRELTRSSAPLPWVMLSHATVASLDAAHPASASGAVIAVLRRDWGFDGILVTDDIWMAPYRASLEDNLVASLAGGADVILIAYDPDLAYVALDALLRARRDGRLSEPALAASDRRLAQTAPAPAASVAACEGKYAAAHAAPGLASPARFR